MGQKSAQGDANGNIIAFYDSQISPAPANATNLVQITDAQWQDCIANPGKYIISNGALTLTPAPTAAQLAATAHAQLVQAAQAELDIVTGGRGQIIRCVAAGIAVPAAWTNYVIALRAIVNGTDTTSTTLPVPPAFVAGT